MSDHPEYEDLTLPLLVWVGFLLTPVWLILGAYLLRLV